jgi:putative chitinase
MISISQLQAIMPAAKSRAQIYLAHLNAAMDEYSIDTPLRMSAFLASVSVESGQLLYVRELASGRAYTNRADLGNTRPEARIIAQKHGIETGTLYKGGGLMQITGYDNYKDCALALGINCVAEPSLLEEPVNAARSAAWFWHSRKLNKLADAGDFRAITRIINGGYNGWNERLAAYNRALKAFGITENKP